jgi:hypothetical protein
MSKFITRFLFAAPLAAAVLIAPNADAQITKQGNGYLLRMKFAPKMSATYSMVSKGSGAGQTFTTTMTVKQTVQSVKNGVATMVYNVSGMTMNGQKSTQTPQAITVQVNNRGKIMGNSTGNQMMNSSIELPAGPVPIGGKWSAKMTVPAGPMGNLTMNSNYKLSGVKTVNGIPCAVIEVSGTGKSAQMNVTTKGTLLLRLSDGSLQSTNQTQTMAMTMGGGQSGKTQTINVTNTMTMTRK